MKKPMGFSKMKAAVVAAFAATAVAFAAVADTTVATATWKNGGDRNPANPANWVCKDAGGEVIVGAVPTADTVITISGSTDFNLPAGTQIAAKNIVFENVKLAQDADWQGKVKPPQTTSYTPIEYLVAPSGVIVDTLFNPNEKTRIKMVLEVKAKSEYWFGVWNVGYSNGAFAMGNDGGNVYIGYGNQGGGNGTTFVPVGKTVTVELNRTEASVTDVSDGTVYNEKTFTANTFQCNGPLYLFGQNHLNDGSVNAPGDVKMYSCQIWDDDVLVRNFIPVRWGDQVCLWDTETKIFYTGEGAKAITSDAAATGAAVEVSRPAANACSELAYIDVPGKQFIYDTGFVANQDTHISMTIEPKTNWEFWFGVKDGGGGNFTAGNSAGSFYSAYGSGGGENKEGVGYDCVPTDKISVVDMNKNVYTVTTDGAEIYHRDWTYTEFSTVLPVILFGRNHVNSSGEQEYEYGYGQERVRMYSCQIYDNGTLVHDYVPALYGKKIGIYDKKTQTFTELTRVDGSKNLSGGKMVGVKNLPLKAAEDDLPPLAFNASAVIDVNGHTLTVDGATLQESSMGATVTSKIDGGKFVVNVAKDSTVADSNLSFTDKLNVVKEGEGVLQMLHGWHTFTGGLDINGGTLQPTRDLSCSDYGILGKNNWSYTKINVNEGGTYDINGSFGCWGYCLVANGGTLVNTYSRFHDKAFYDTTLKASTVFNVEKNYALNGDRPHPMDYGLGGNMLTINISKDQTLRASWVQFHDGTVVINGEGTFSVMASSFDGNNDWGNTPCDCGGASARVDLKPYLGGITPIDLVLNCKCDLQKLMTVNTLTLGENGSIVGSASIGISGYYIPAAQAFPNIVMQAGSMLDLTDIEGVFSVYGRMGEANTKIAFAETGTITVDVSGRTLSKGEQVIAWNVEDKPDAEFAFVNDSMAAVVMDDGLYYGGDEESTEVVTAEWTGAAGNGDLKDPRNWTCLNPSGSQVAGGLPAEATKVRLTGETLNIVVPAGTDFVCDSCTIIGSKTLTGDCDLSGFGNIIFDEGVEFDVGAYELTVGKSFFVSSAVRTVTTDTAGGTLKVVVEETEEVVNTIVALTGKLKLVKAGAGIFEQQKQFQEFSGGIDVVEGTLRGTKGLSVGDYKPFGPSWYGSGSGNKKDWCTVTIRKGATYDVNGSIKFWGVLMVLDGGTLHNTIARTGDISIDDVRLTADSTLDISEDWLLWSNRESIDEPSYFNLGGHKLTVNIAEGKTLDSQWGKFANGTLEVNGGTLKIRNGRKDKYPLLDSGRDDLDLVINTALVMENQMSVRSYTIEENGSVSGTAPIMIAGTWKPEDTAFPNIVMKNGSTLDLTDVEGTFDTASTVDGCSLTFAANATVTIDVHGRDLSTGAKLIAWAAKPSANFALDATSIAADGHIAATPEGLFFGGDPTSKDVDVAYWTGAEDADFSNPANWACTNSSGYVVANGVPDENSKIHFASPTMHVVISENLACALFCIDASATLTGDSDLTGVGAITFAEGVTIDLDGHALKVGESFFNAPVLKTVTSSKEGAVLEAVIGENSTVNDNTIQIDGKINLMKSGDGMMEMLKGKHTFTGGLDINGGTLRPGKEVACSDGGFLGLSNWSWTMVRINEGGTYDINGSRNCWGYHIVVNGGKIVNTHGAFWDLAIFDTTLMTDTEFDVVERYALNGNRDNPMDYNLGGKTLTVNISKDKTLRASWVQFHDGTVVINGEGTFSVQASGFDSNNNWENTPCNCGGVDFRLKPDTYPNGIKPMDLVMNGNFELLKAMTVHDFTCNATKVTGGETLTVLGTFKPVSLNFPSIELADGATLDLGAFSKTFGADSVAFADGATIKVSCGDRELTGATKLMSWATAPANLSTLKFEAAGALKQGGWSIVAKPDGVYVQQRGFMLFVR